jgi:hypothetical protein
VRGGERHHYGVEGDGVHVGQIRARGVQGLEDGQGVTCASRLDLGATGLVQQVALVVADRPAVSAGQESRYRAYVRQVVEDLGMPVGLCA